MTNQELFDTIVEHLRKQGIQSWTPTLACMYRGPNGLKCAAGALIPDEVYSQEMEGRVATEPSLCKVWEQLGFDDRQISLIRDLQRVHDCNYPHYWESALQRVAVCYGLVYTDPRQESVK